MTASASLPVDFAPGLARAVILFSPTPLLLLGEGDTVLAASRSFQGAFGIDPLPAVPVRLSSLGQGEWDVPQLDALIRAAAAGFAAVEVCEMDLARPGRPTRRLSIDARRLDYPSDPRALVVMSVGDVTDARQGERRQAGLMREKAVLLEELQHRVANSLQINASVLLQSARTARSEEARSHINQAHHRVMSVAELQRQLAASGQGEVELSLYLASLCRSSGASMIRDPAKIALVVEVGPHQVAANVALSLGLIVTELVINALKHAFPGDRGGRIVVAYRSAGDGWTLSVGDDGVGMETGEGATKAGLGSSIVRALAMQLDARIATSDARPGTLVSVSHAVVGQGAAALELAAV